MLIGAERRARTGDPPRRGVVRRVLRAAGIALGALVGIVAGLLVLVLLLLDTPPARRLAAREVNAILEPSFQGRIHIDRIGRLGLFGVGETEATIFDPSGVPVIVARGVSAEVASVAALRSVLFGKSEPLTIHLTSAGADSIDVRLDADAAGGLVLADAFASKKPPSPPDPHARGFRLEIHAIGLGHVHAHGTPPGAPALDADLVGLAGSFSLTPDFIEGDVSSAAVTAHHILENADVSGFLVAHVKWMSAPPSALSGSANWLGFVGGISHSIHATYVDDRLDAVVDAPRVEPDALRALWAGSTLQAPANLHAEAHGTMPRLGFDVHAGLGGGSIDVNGDAVLGDTKTVKLHLDAQRIDAREIEPSMPASRLALVGDVDAEMAPSGAMSGRAEAHFQGGSVAGREVPPDAIAAAASRTATGELEAHAAVTVEAPYAPTRIHLAMSPEGKASKVDVDLRSDAAELDAIPILDHAVRGRVHVQGQATLHTGPMSIDADVQAQASQIAQGTTRVGSASVAARAHGPVGNPRVDASVRAEDLVVGGRHLTSANVVVTGPAMAPHVTASVRASDLPDVDAAVDLVVRGGPSVRGVHVALAGEGEHALVTAKGVSVGGGTVRVDGLRVEGLGSPLEATLALSSAGARIQAATQGLSLERVGHLMHLEKWVRGGMLAFDTDVTGKGLAWKGHGKIDLSEASVDAVKGVSVHADLEVDGHEIRGKVHADALGIGSVDIDVPKLDVGVFSAPWRRAFGRVDVDAQADLAKVAALFPPDTLPLSEAKGTFALKAHLARDDARDMTPDVSVTLSTRGLTIAPRKGETRDIPGTRILDHPPWRLAGIDVRMTTTIDGKSGRLVLDTEVRDAKGPLAEVRGHCDAFPYADVFGDTERLWADLRKTPAELDLTIPERGLGSLPDALKQTYLTGRLKGTVAFRGTLVSPTVDIDAALGHSRLVRGAHEEYLDFALVSHYDGARATASIKARSGDKQLLTVDGQVDAAIAPLVDGNGPPPWKASMKGHFDAFPLEAIPVLDDRLISGRLTGDVAVAGLHENAHANAALSIEGLKVGRVAYDSAKAKLDADGRALDAEVRFDQSDGFFRAHANAVTRWGTAVAPSLDPSRPLHAELDAKHFRVAVLLPFLEGALDELDGWLDASTRIELDPRTRGAKLSGNMNLSGGIVQAAAGGGELHDLTAQIRLSPDGAVTLEKLSAAGLSGRMEATGAAKLDGVALRSANAVVTIPSSAPMPMSGGGAEIGNVDGRFEIAVVASPGGPTALTIKVPHVRVALPSGNTTNAQSLGPMTSGIRIGARRGMPATFVLVPPDPAPEIDPTSGPSTSGGTRVEADIADAQVIRGTDIKVDMSGNIAVAAGATTQVTGQIRLKQGGYLTVQGRKFTVDSGTVTMNGADSSNPVVVVRAYWQAPPKGHSFTRTSSDR